MLGTFFHANTVKKQGPLRNLAFWHPKLGTSAPNHSKQTPGETQNPFKHKNTTWSKRSDFMASWVTPGAPKGAPGCQNGAPGCPKLMFWEPKRDPKGAIVTPF